MVYRVIHVKFSLFEKYTNYCDAQNTAWRVIRVSSLVLFSVQFLRILGSIRMALFLF